MQDSRETQIDTLVEAGLLVWCRRCHGGFRWKTARQQGLHNFFAGIYHATAGEWREEERSDGRTVLAQEPPTKEAVSEAIDKSGLAVEHLSHLFFAEEREMCRACNSQGVVLTVKGREMRAFVSFLNRDVC